MTKQGGKGKYQSTHKTKSTNYNKVQVLYHHLNLGGTISVYCNPLGT